MKLGILGTGLMGIPVALRLNECGFEVVAWNRTSERAARLLDSGVAVYPDFSDFMANADTLLLFLSDAEAIEEVLFSQARPLLAGKTLVQMGTIAPAQSLHFFQQAAEHGAQWLESPVLGSIPEAREGRLLLMVGAEEPQFVRLDKVFSALGEAPVWVGPVGQAAALKLSMNQLIAGLTATFSLSLGMVMRSGVDVETFMQLVRQSALYAPTFDKKLGKMLADDFDNPNFPLKHLSKDVDLFIEAAADLGLDTSMLEGIASQIDKGLRQGDANQDYSVIFRAITSS